MARLECINQWIVKHQFAHAFYNAYALLKITPEPNLYADFLYNAMATSMYGMSKHKTNGSLRNVLGKVSDIEGEQQGAYYFWDVLNRQEFNVLALRMLWIAKSRQPDNPFLTKMANNLITDMVKTFKLKLDNFCDYPMGTNVDSIFDDPQTETQEATNKYDRIKQQKTTAKIKPSEKFKPVNYMLGDLKQDNDFVAFVQQRQNELEDAEILDAVKQPVTPHVQNDKLLFMKPRYLFVTKDRYSETKSKQGEKHLKTAIEKSVERLKIDNEFLDDVQIGQYSAAQYNSYGMLYDWIEYIYSIEGHIEPYYAVDVEGIAQDCQYLVMTSVVVQPRSMFTYTKIQDIMLSAICFYVSPAHIAGLFVARRNANSYFSVVNLKDGQVFYFANDYRERTHCTEGLIHAFMYDCLYALKKESKK
jgi:hypothetical protein